MEWTPLDLRLDAGIGRPERSSGVHLTEIREYILKRVPMLAGRRKRSGIDMEGWRDAAGVGFAWEEAMAQEIGKTLPVPLVRGVEGGKLELVSDGVVMTPDGIDAVRNEVWEFKFTWASVATSPPQEQWGWQMQMMGYARALGRNVEGEWVGNLAAMYVCGDYRPPNPRFVGWKIKFEEDEIERNWEMVLEAKRMMEQEGRERKGEQG